MRAFFILALSEFLPLSLIHVCFCSDQHVQNCDAPVTESKTKAETKKVI